MKSPRRKPIGLTRQIPNVDRYVMCWRGDGVETEEVLDGSTMSEALAAFERAVSPVRYGTASLVCYPKDPKPYGPRVVVMTYVPDNEA